MNKVFNHIGILFLVGLFIGACADENELIEERQSIFQSEETETLSLGTIDASNFVSVGNSLTAGFMDGALYKAGQEHSMPNLLASAMQQAGGGEFVQPIIETQNGFNSAFSNVALGIIKGRSILDTEIPGPVPTDGDIASLQSLFTGAKLNNFGVPGIRAVEVGEPLVGDPANGNPYYARIASAPGTSSYIQDVGAAQASFFTLWLGNNDVLSYATGGGVGGDGETNQALDANRSTLVSNASFQASYDAMLGVLTAGGQKGILLNIPPITVIPFFRAVPYNAIEFSNSPVDVGTVTALNAGFENFNQAIIGLTALNLITSEDSARRIVNYEVGTDTADSKNPVLIIDEDLLDISQFNPLLTGFGQIRPADSTDLILLTAGAVLGTLDNPSDPSSVIGVSVPLSDQYVLTGQEQSLINSRIAQFNAHIASKASDDIAIFDINTYFLENVLGNGGFDVDGVKLLPDFSPNGVFSTDGIHPNPRGNAIVANRLIELINNKWGANLPSLSPLNYPGVTVK